MRTILRILSAIMIGHLLVSMALSTMVFIGVFKFPNDGTTLTDVVCDMFGCWIDYKKNSGEFPDA